MKAAALLLALLMSSASPAPSPTPTTPTPSPAPPGISMTIVNWGTPTAIDDPTRKAWAHLSANAAPIEVTVRVDRGDSPPPGFLIRFSAPDAFQGPAVQYCADTTHQLTRVVECAFKVPISRGPNRILVDFSDDAGHVEAEGAVYGGDLAASATIQVLDGQGIWRDLADRDTFVSPGGVPTAVRYRLTNTGDIPFRVTDSCREGLVALGSFRICSLRGLRPMYAAAGEYNVPVKLDDPAGGTAIFTLRGRLEVPGHLVGPNG